LQLFGTQKFTVRAYFGKISSFKNPSLQVAHIRAVTFIVFTTLKKHDWSKNQLILSHSLKTVWVTFNNNMFWLGSLL
jgi:hypothetical protein